MRALVAAVTAAGFVVGTGPARADDGPLTIELAVKLALTKNERAQIADLNVVVADAAVTRAWVSFLPVLNATAGDTLRPRDTPKNIATGQVTLSQPLIDPTAFPRLAVAKHQLLGQRAQTIDDKRKLAFDAAKAFVGVLLAQQVVSAAERKLQTAKANLADTDAQAKAQLVSTNDVTRAQISLAGTDRELAADQGKLRAAYIQLAFVMNAPPPVAVAPPTQLLAGAAAKQPDEETLIKQSLAKRPDLEARRESAIAAHESTREPRLHYLPSLALGANINVTSNPGSSGHDVDGQIALTANWLIYDGGSRKADIMQRDAQASIADLTTQTLIRQIETDVRNAENDLLTAQAELTSARETEDAAKRGADEAAILYRQGLAKAIELLDANDQLFEADVNLAGAEFDVASAYLELRQAMGFDPLEAR
jgi:outer membrane protein TolC